MAALVARSPLVMTALTVASAVYLVWLGSTWLVPVHGVGTSARLVLRALSHFSGGTMVVIGVERLVG